MADASKSPLDPTLMARMMQLAAHRELIENLCSQPDVARFGFTAASFTPHLARSAASRFKTHIPSATALENYLSGLCLQDFALACACAEGQEEAWDFFVNQYRGYLRRCAGAMLRCGAEAPEARELADSMFAELYGLADGRRGTSSLFRYFHGRSSLKTWLRAVLAQRHVDAIRAARRFETLEEEDGAGQLAVGDARERGGNNASASSARNSVGPFAIPPDPYRKKYIELFCGALQSALARLDAADHRRICLYYAEGKTLAEVGRLCQEHESSVSRNLERIRRELRMAVEGELRRGRGTNRAADGDGGGGGGLSDAQIALCLQYATEDAPIDFHLLFPSDGNAQPSIVKRNISGENS